jgi:hypothetical protein
MFPSWPSKWLPVEFFNCGFATNYGNQGCCAYICRLGPTGKRCQVKLLELQSHGSYLRINMKEKQYLATNNLHTEKGSLVFSENVRLE